MEEKDRQGKKPIKETIFRVIFWLSWLPYAFLLLSSLYHAVFGYVVSSWINGVYIRTIYGWEAFETDFFWNFLSLTVIPVLPTCLIYQLFYWIRKSRKRQ